MSIPNVTTFVGTPPTTSDPANFDTRADAFVEYIADLAPELNAFAAGANALSGQLQGIADDAADSAAAAAAGATTAALSAQLAAASANYRGEYSAGTTYTVGQSVSYQGAIYIAKKTNLGITPADGADWLVLPDTGLAANPLIDSAPYTRTFANGTPGTFPAMLINLDADREMLLFSNGHALIYNRSTQALGAVASFRATTNLLLAALVLDANTVLVASSTSTALQVVVLTLSGESITVNTPASITLPTGAAFLGQLITVGASYVLSVGTSAPSKLLYALTVSGTTVTAGSPITLTGSNNIAASLVAVDSSRVLAVHHISGTGYATPVSVSGTTLTAGTEASISATGAAHIIVGLLSTGRYLLMYGTNGLATLCTVSGTVATLSTGVVALGLATSESAAIARVIDGASAIISGSGSVLVVTDTSGVVSVASVSGSVGGSSVQTANSILVSSGRFTYRHEFVAGAHAATLILGVTVSALGATANAYPNLWGVYRGTALHAGSRFFLRGGPGLYVDGSQARAAYARSPFDFFSSVTPVTLDGQAAWSLYAPNAAVTNVATLTRHAL